MNRTISFTHFRNLVLGSLLASTAACGGGGAAQDGGADGATGNDAPAAVESGVDVISNADSSSTDAGTVDSSARDSSARDSSAGDVTTTDAGAPDGTPAGFLDRYPLQARYPEGGTFDPVDNAFYVGSLDDGSVHRVDAATGAETVLFTETAPGNWWTLGMTVDTTRRRLWVCAMDDRSPSPRAGRIWIFDLATGARVADHALSDAATDATCTDVAVTQDGRGFVGDREQGNIYEVDETLGAALFVTDPSLQSDFVGQNAIVVLPDESALLSLIYGPPSIVRVDLTDRSVRAVTFNGSFSDSSFLAGADGMTYANGSAYVAFTSKLVRVTPDDATWATAATASVDIPNGMTDVVSTPGGLYLLNGQSIVFGFGGTPDPFALARFDGTL